MRADMLGLTLQSIQLLSLYGLTLVFVDERSLMIIYLYVQYMISVYGAQMESGGIKLNGTKDSYIHLQSGGIYY